MFGDKIKELRLQRGWTQQEVAERVGLKKSMISMLERNERKPSFEVLEAFADVFNVDLDMLAGDRRSQTDELRDMLKEKHSLRMLLKKCADFSTNRVYFDVIANILPQLGYKNKPP